MLESTLTDQTPPDKPPSPIGDNPPFCWHVAVRGSDRIRTPSEVRVSFQTEFPAGFCLTAAKRTVRPRQFCAGGGVKSGKTFHLSDSNNTHHITTCPILLGYCCATGVSLPATWRSSILMSSSPNCPSGLCAQYQPMTLTLTPIS